MFVHLKVSVKHPSHWAWKERIVHNTLLIGKSYVYGYRHHGQTHITL